MSSEYGIYIYTHALYICNYVGYSSVLSEAAYLSTTQLQVEVDMRHWSL